MSRGPLQDVLIVDLTRVLAGPFCTMVLSDLGARVVKVEHPERGDDARAIGPFVDGSSAYFASLNRGKESIALDLKDEADRSILDRLLGRADVLVENFRPGALERLGLGWEAVHARHPRLVFASTSGFGQTGPYAARAAYDMVVQGMGGLMSVTGHPGAPPTRVGTSIGDIAAGLFTAVGIGGALHHRERTGRGIHVDVAMLDCQIAILENAIARYFASGESPGPIGARHPSIAPFAAFAAADGHVIIAAGNDRLFERLLGALDRPELAKDERFASNDARTRNADALAAELERTLCTQTSAHWLSLLEAEGIPCGPMNDVAAALADPQVEARNMVVEAPDEAGRRWRMAGNPIKLSGFPDPDARGPVPALDADREAILRDLLGDE